MLEVQKYYNRQEDRLFLVYYALPTNFNANNWRVSEHSLDTNVKSGINKPVIIYPKDPKNQFHTKQAGNFVHPTVDEAAADLGVPRHTVTESQYYQWQEKFAVGRVRDIEKREGKGYAFTLEITDPASKEILKSDKYEKGIPGWTSPQILYYPGAHPQEEKSGTHDHWIISHVLLTDSPAYGFQKSALRGKCLGEEQECLIKTKNASLEENLGFCIKQATIDLIQSTSHDFSDSSQNLASSTDVHRNLSSTATNEGTPAVQTQLPKGEVLTTKTLTFSEQNPKQEGEQQQAPPEGSGQSSEGDAHERDRPQQEDPSTQDAPKSLTEATEIIKELRNQILAKDQMLKDNTKSMSAFEKRLNILEHDKRFYEVSTLIPRELFKSDEAHKKEVARVITNNSDRDKEFLTEHYQLMRKARSLEQQVEIPTPQIRAKSASSEEREVPNYNNTDTNTDYLSSTIDRELSLGRKMFGGGRTI